MSYAAPFEFSGNFSGNCQRIAFPARTTASLKKRSKRADEVGFEPTLPARVKLISSQPHSTTLPLVQLSYPKYPGIRERFK